MSNPQQRPPQGRPFIGLPTSHSSRTQALWAILAAACLAAALALIPPQTASGMGRPRPGASGVRAVSLSRAPLSGLICASTAVTTTLYLPLLYGPDFCGPISGEEYSALTVLSAKTDRPAEVHADLNLSLRGYESTGGFAGLVDIDGSTDTSAPQLASLFGDNRTPIFHTLYQVHNWNWTTNSRGSLLTDPSVTLAGLSTTPGEIIHVPKSGDTIGSQTKIPLQGVALGSGGYAVLVLYAAPDRITLKYTREDNVIIGYTLHIENICVEPTLLALYESWNYAGRSSLPALKSGQGIGRATGAEIGVAIRDCGTFMDPRSRKDWWQGR